MDGDQHPSEPAQRVSVALPVCDNERFVEFAVRSILDQSLQPYEFVIGDDGSQDGTSAMLADLASEHRHIRLLRRDRRSGLANAANWVVANTQGNLVALAHADDLSHPDRLAVQVAALAGRPDSVLVGAPAIGIDETGRQVHPANLWRLTRPSVFAPFTHSSVMFRRQAFIDAGGYRADADYWEDLDLFWRMARLGGMLVLPRAVTSYRYSGDSFRSRGAAAEVERAVQRMYDCAGDAASGDRGAAAARTAARPQDKVRPRVFIARSWVSVWCARRPGTLRRLLQQGRLRADRESLLALVFVSSGTVAPRLFRKALQLAASVRNWVARRGLAYDAPVEWRPFKSEE